MWPVLMILLGLLLIGALSSKKKPSELPLKPLDGKQIDESLKSAKKKKKRNPGWIATYAGGSLDADPGRPMLLRLQDAGITLHWGRAINDPVEIPFVCMDRVQSKSKREINEDMKAGRLFIFDPQLFRGKRDEEDIVYNVIRGRDIDSTTVHVVLQRHNEWEAARTSDQINKARKEYRDHHPDEMMAQTLVYESTPVESDPMLRIEKLKSLLDLGAITQEEYEQKKIELLRRI